MFLHRTLNFKHYSLTKLYFFERNVAADLSAAGNTTHSLSITYNGRQINQPLHYA
jgi:hypothetical protein